MGNALWSLIKSEPVAVAFLVSTAIGTAVAFGAHVSVTQSEALNALVAAALSVIVRQNVSPVQK